MEYYSALKISDILKFAGKWMELGNSQPELGNPDPKGKHGMYLLKSGY